MGVLLVLSFFIQEKRLGSLRRAKPRRLIGGAMKGSGGL